MMSLGFVYRFISNIESLMFGFVNLLKVTIGQYMAENLSNMLFGKDELHGIFHLILTIGYILVGIQMFTGKNITGEQ